MIKAEDLDVNPEVAEKAAEGEALVASEGV